MKYSNIKYLDISNGPGLRTSVFVSGCLHECYKCFNAKLWNFNYGDEFTDDVIQSIIEETKKEYCSGLSILGGEPLAPNNQKRVNDLIQEFKKQSNKSIWLYSGFTFDVIQKYMFDNEKFPYIKDLIHSIDVLVDGRYIEELRDLGLQFRGSKNQRVIDVKRSLQEGKIIWLNDITDQNKYIRRSF